VPLSLGIKYITPTYFDLRLQEEEGLYDIHNPETVHYLVVSLHEGIKRATPTFKRKNMRI